MRLSVIVPVYGTEQYLRRCLDSIGNAPYIEVIVVDDGSKGDCEAIVQEYVSKGLNFKYVAHGENRGLLQARLTGVDHARGRYIAHLDSDDWVSKGVYERLLQEIEKSGAVMGMFNVEYSYSDGTHGRVDYLEDNLNEPASYFVEKILACNPGEYIWHLSHNKIWEASLLRRVYAKIPKDKHLVMCEDLLLSLKLLFYSEEQLCISRLKSGTLYYFQHEESSTKTNKPVSSSLIDIQDLILVKDMLLNGSLHSDQREKVIQLMKYMSRLNHPQNKFFMRNPYLYFRGLVLIALHLDSGVFLYKAKRSILVK